MTREPEDRGQPTTVRRVMIFTERLAWLVAASSLGVCGFLYVAGVAGRHRDLDRFEALRSAERLHADEPDQRLWSPNRRPRWRETLIQTSAAALAGERSRGI